MEDEKMSEISVGIIYLPSSYEKMNLKKLYDEIAEGNEFEVKRFVENHHIILFSTDKNVKIIVDADGIVYYIKWIKKDDFTLMQIFNIAKKGFNFIQSSSLNKNYLKRLGLVVGGEDMKKFYAEKEEVVKEFGSKLFKNPSFKELEKTDFGVQMSIVSKGVPLLSFASND